MEGDLQRRIGANLRAQRTRRKLSRREFADMVGKHFTYIGAVERGERNVTVKTIERLAASLGITPDTLLRRR